MSNDLGNILPAPEIRICSLCQSEYTAYYEGSHICGTCIRKKEHKEQYAKKLARKQAISDIPHQDVNNDSELIDDIDYDVLQEVEIAPNRKCHDCGKWTNNYRCQACLIEWRIKNHIPQDIQNLNGIDE